MATDIIIIIIIMFMFYLTISIRGCRPKTSRCSLRGGSITKRPDWEIFR